MPGSWQLAVSQTDSRWNVAVESFGPSSFAEIFCDTRWVCTNYLYDFPEFHPDRQQVYTRFK